MKKIAVVKLNRGAWLDYREELIKKHKQEGDLVTYSDTTVVTHDVTYEVKIVLVNPFILDPLLGYEGYADATDLVKFLDSIREKVIKDYMPEPKGIVAAPDDFGVAQTFKPVMPASEEDTKTEVGPGVSG